MVADHVEDLVEEYALGLLSEEEAARVEAHTATCAACRRELDSALRTAALLAAVAEPAEPPAAASERLLSRVARTRQPEPEKPRRLGFGVGGILWPAVAGLSLVLALAMVVWNVSLQTQLQQVGQQNLDLSERLNRQERRVALVAGPQTDIVEMNGTDESPGSKGRAYLDDGTGTVWVTVSGLPQQDASETYQLWLIGSQGPVSAGFLAATSGGRYEAWLSDMPNLNSYQAVCVSLEQAGGSSQPTKVMVLGGY
jgi:anti-sigma-K factor RskA